MNTSTGDHSKIIKIVLLILFIFSIIANGIQGYFILKQAKAYRDLKAIINSKSNCEKCPEQIESTPEPTPTPTTTTKSRGSGSGSDSDSNVSEDTIATPEPVIPPPPPPAD